MRVELLIEHIALCSGHYPPQAAGDFFESSAARPPGERNRNFSVRSRVRSSSRSRPRVFSKSFRPPSCSQRRVRVALTLRQTRTPAWGLSDSSISLFVPKTAQMWEPHTKRPSLTEKVQLGLTILFAS